MRHIWGIGLGCSLVLAQAGALRAHPHIFVEAGVEILFDDAGAPEGLRISWVYDEFFSMLLVSDMGLDPGFTGTLTAEERPLLDGFDMNWIEGYHGDTHVTQDGSGLRLTGPLEWESDYVDGQLRSSHLRHFLDHPEPDRDWIISIHDPTYFTSYTITSHPVVTGRMDCTTRIFEPDWEQAGAQLEQALDELLGAGGDIEADFPPVGALFAEEIWVRCG